MKQQNLIERLTSQLGGDKEKALGILRKQGSVQQDSEELTQHGKERSAMTPGERAIDRQSRYSGRPKGAFRYDAETNRATVKPGLQAKRMSAEALKKSFRGR